MLQIKRYNKTRQTDEAVLSLQDIPEGAIVHRELMGDHYIKLPFSYDEPVYLNVGDWCEIVGYGKFELTEPYSPKYNTETGGYDYELQLNAHYKKWKNKICKYMPSSGGKETSFDLTASLGVHLAVIIENITALGAKDSSFKYRVDENTLVNFSADIDAAHVDSTAAKHKRYENTDIISALDDLADIYDCEWWVDDNIIRFGRLEIEGEPTPFNVDVEDANVENNVSSISSTESKKEYANRLYVFGSDRNIPKNYRPVQGADITVNGVVQKRLMLPEELPEELPEGFEVPEGVILGSGYIQDGELEESEVVEAVMIDDDIYPRTKCHISRIETYTKTYTDEETNRQVTQTFYRLYDDSGFRFSNSIRLEREELRILFVSGSMNGMDFECIYNDKNKYYEVVVNDDYGRELPDTDLHPSVGDYFVIYGWDSTKMASTGLIADAELELYQSAVKKLAKLKIDPNVYTCKMDSEWYERERRVSGVSYAHFDLGQKVLLNSRAVSVEGRESRIIGFEFKLDIPYDSPEYIVGEATAYSRSSDMQSQIDAITFNGSSYHVTGGGGGSSIFVISSTSKVQSSDTNVYSAKRTDFDFLHKREPDEAKEEIGFVKGLWVKMKGLFTFTENGDLTARTLKATGSSGSTTADIDNITRKNLGLEVVESGIIGGVLRVAKSILTKTIQSINFTGGDSLFGTGWQLTDNDGNGNSRLVVDNLFVRMKAVFSELEVRKFVSMGGNYVFSPAASIIEEVDYIRQNRDITTGEVIGEEVLGYTYVKVPWLLRLVPLSLVGKILSRKKLVRTTISASELSQVNVFRCWLRSDDGTTRTINTWQEGMLARCQTFNMASGSEASHTGTWNDEQGGKSITNKLYWRAVTGVGEAKTKDNYNLENHILEDGLTHNYIDLSNDAGMFLAGSDKPEALDNIVCFGDWLDNNLSNLIVIETIGDDAPAIKEFLGVGYADGASIDWTLTNKMRTKISPKTGNRFVAPDFDIITTNGSVGLKESVEAAGLHINGENSSIDLIAGKVNFVDPNGEPYQTPKISIDPTTGTLHAVGGSFSGTINAYAGTFAGTLSGATGTFSGQLSSLDGKVILTTSRTEADVDWRGLAVMNRENDNFDLGDLATFGARVYPNRSFGRIALAKRTVTSSGGSIRVTPTIPIILNADDGSIKAVSMEVTSIKATSVEANGAAIDITKGVVSGLRFPVTIIDESSVFGDSISIVCDNLVGNNSSSAVHVRSGGVFIISGTTQRTIALPNGVENGTIYTFLFYTNNATISSNSNFANIYTDGNPNAQFTISSSGKKTAKLIFANGFWYSITQ